MATRPAKPATKPVAAARAAARTAPRRRLDVEARRQQLLALGLLAFSRQPYDQVSVDAIAGEAGVSRSLLFHYFSSKRGYYVAVVQAAAEQLLARAFEVRDGEPEQRLAMGLHAYFTFVHEHGSTYATLFRATDPDVQNIVQSTRDMVAARLHDDIGEARLTVTDPRNLRMAVRGWIGFVEALALDSLEHADASLGELVMLALRAFAVVVPTSADRPG